MIADGTVSLIWLVDGMRECDVVSFKTVRGALRAVCLRYEIVLVTRDVVGLARQFSGADPNVMVIVPERLGDGVALVAGCAAATGDYLLVVSGRSLPDWEALPSLVPFLEHADVITAFRPGIAGATSFAWSALMSAAYAFLFGITLRDPFNPVKLYRAELLRGLSFVSRGPALHLELIAKARAQGATIIEVGVPAMPPADVAPGAVGSGETVRLWLHLRAFRPRWMVRARRTMRTPSEYAVSGAMLTAFVWFVRGRIARLQNER